MYSYFTLPYNLFKEENIKAYDNTKFCQNQNEEQSPKTKLVVGERTYKLPTFTEEELQNEVWKQIVGSPNYYISNLGRIYSTFTNKIRKPKLSPLDKKKNNPVSITLSYQYEDEYGNEISFVSCKTYVSLMKENFDIEQGQFCYRNTDVYVIYKDNNPFNCRLSNLLLTSNQNLIRYVRECNIRNGFDICNKKKTKELSFMKQEDYNGDLFLIRDDFVNEYISKIEDNTKNKHIHPEDICSIESINDDYVLLRCNNVMKKKFELLEQCKNQQSKLLLRLSFKLPTYADIHNEKLPEYIQKCRDYVKSQNNNNKNNS